MMDLEEMMNLEYASSEDLIFNLQHAEFIDHFLVMDHIDVCIT